MFLLCGNIIKTSTKGKEIHISCKKANLVNKAKDVKSNFKALGCEQISRVEIIEFS